jgi:hypothetical protein
MLAGQGVVTTCQDATRGGYLRTSPLHRPLPAEPESVYEI